MEKKSKKDSGRKHGKSRVNDIYRNVGTKFLEKKKKLYMKN